MVMGGDGSGEGKGKGRDMYEVWARVMDGGKVGNHSANTSLMEPNGCGKEKRRFGGPCCWVSVVRGRGGDLLTCGGGGVRKVTVCGGGGGY